MGLKIPAGAWSQRGEARAGLWGGAQLTWVQVRLERPAGTEGWPREGASWGKMRWEIGWANTPCLLFGMGPHVVWLGSPMDWVPRWGGVGDPQIWCLDQSHEEGGEGLGWVRLDQLPSGE